MQGLWRYSSKFTGIQLNCLFMFYDCAHLLNIKLALVLFYPQDKFANRKQRLNTDVCHLW